MNLAAWLVFTTIVSVTLRAESSVPMGFPKDTRAAYLCRQELQIQEKSLEDSSTRSWSHNGATSLYYNNHHHDRILEGFPAEPLTEQVFPTPEGDDLDPDGDQDLYNLNLTKDLIDAARVDKIHFTPDQSSRKLLNQTCISFEASPRHPKSNVEIVVDPWSPSRAWTCKILATFSRASQVCSGSLVGPLHLITARHCTVHGCLGTASSVRVMCGYGHVADGDSFAHYGSAFATTAIRFKSYDNALGCSNGKQVGVRADLDLQLLKLDRRVGDVVGWAGASVAGVDRVSVQGYPGDPKLTTFLPFSSHQMLFRRSDIEPQNNSSKLLRLANAWVFPGESGCPYYNSRGVAREVVAVHHGGSTGCLEVGRKLDKRWIEVIKGTRGIKNSTEYPKWTAPLHCQILQLHVDIFKEFGGELKGVRKLNMERLTKAIVVPKGARFLANVTLFNAGNAPSEKVELKWFAGEKHVRFEPL